MLATCPQDDLLKILDTIGVPTFAVDVLEDGGFRFAGVNPRHQEVSGISTALIRGKAPAEVLPPGDAAAVEARYRDCVAKRAPIEYDEELELPGAGRCWRTVLVPLFDSSGRVVRLMGTATDVTERKVARQS